MSKTDIWNDSGIWWKSIFCVGVSLLNFLKAYLVPFNILNMCLDILDWLILLITHTHTKESSINIEGSLLTLEWYDHCIYFLLKFWVTHSLTGVWLQWAVNVPPGASACALTLSSYVRSLLDSWKRIYSGSPSLLQHVMSSDKSTSSQEVVTLQQSSHCLALMV